MKDKSRYEDWAYQPGAAVTQALTRGQRKFNRGKARRHLEIMNGETTMATKTVTKKTPGIKDAVKASQKKKATKKATPKKTATKKAKSDLIPLKKICGTKMNPRLARRKLREANLSGHDQKARWEFTPAQVKKIEKVLFA